MKKALLTLALAFLWISTVQAVEPPTLINYQGVLRDAGDNPLDGDYDMIFRFYNAPAGGVEILVDEHRASGAGPVTSTDGMFSVALGSGLVTDGGGSGVYTNLGQVFRDYSGVWVEITIDVGVPEVLSPRVHVVASAYALNALNAEDAVVAQVATWADNAGLLGGVSSSGYINTYSGAQTKNGDLTVSDLTLNGNDLRFGYGAKASSTSLNLQISAGNVSTDDLLLSAGTSQAHGGITLIGTGQIDLKAGSGMTRFMRASDDYVTGQINSLGVMTIKGDLQIGSDSTTDDDIITFDGAESLQWSNAETRFEMSDELAIIGPLQVGSTTAATVGYNRIGSIAPDASGDVTAADDLLVSSDLEVGDVLYVGRSIVVGDPTPTTNQAFTSFGSPYEIESIIDSSDDVLVTGHLQVDGYVTSPYSYTTTTTANTVWRIDNNDSSTTMHFSWFHDTNYTTDQLGELDEYGDLRIAGTISQNYSFDLAESFLADEALEPGDLVAISTRRRESVRKSAGANDATVLGVVSTSPGFVLGGVPFAPEAFGTTWGEDVQQEYHAARTRLRDEVQTTMPEFQRRLREIETLDKHSEIDKRSHELDRDLERQVLKRFFRERFVQVALAGRVPVKVDGSFGDIAPGDPLSPSPIPGTAMKADGGGPVIGIALESYRGGRGKVLMFVQRDATSSAAQAQLKETIEARTPSPETGLQSMENDLQIVLDRSGDQEARFSIFRDGETRGDLGAEVFRVDEAGNIFTAGALHPNAMDLAEYFAVDSPVEAGDVLVADRENPGKLRRGSEVADPAVVGVVSTEPGVLLGGGVQKIASAFPEMAKLVQEARALGDREEENRLWAEMILRFRESHAAVAMTGSVPCKVDAGYGAIRIGDLLTVSPTAGHAMRADDPSPGTILGKALETLETGTGRIRILVMMR